MLTVRLRPYVSPPRSVLLITHRTQWRDHRRSREPQVGLTTPIPDDVKIYTSKSPFYFEAGYAGWAKRPSRPFPPPFFSPPSGSFSDPLSTHHRAADRRAQVNGQMIRGVTNGDDALLASDNMIGTNDGVGAWAQKDKGHAPLWSRLILHFWAVAAENDRYGGDNGVPDPVRYLDEAYTNTKEALSDPNAWLGTTTALSAVLHYAGNGEAHPVLYVTQLGDCKCIVVRPKDKSVIFATKEQWHYFDCPRQLGTNSPDQPTVHAVLSKIDIQEDDIILAMSDGVTDNLWETEIADGVVESLENWEAANAGERSGGSEDNKGSVPSGSEQTTHQKGAGRQSSHAHRDGFSAEQSGSSYAEGMRYVAQELVLAARKIAEDPFAASPFMERAIDEGLAIEGGKLDDISVVAAVCKRRESKG